MASEEVFNRRLKRGRDTEWEAIRPFLENLATGRFLDVGCGTGYAMTKARLLNFDVAGIDPANATHGVQDESVNPVSDRIITASAEHIPFPNACFDVVYSSHAIEHFNDLAAGIREISRVLKPNGRAILMIPTGTMAAILVISYWLFYTHRSIGKFLLRTRSMEGFLRIFLGEAHGTESRFAIQEIKNFSINRWRKLIGNYFKIEQEILPCLYPWPDFPQFFPMIQSKRFSTSVVFICKKKADDA